MRLIICVLGLVILAGHHVDCGLLGRLFHHETTTTTTTPAPPRFISNNIPRVDAHCTIVFVCKKKMVVDFLPRPCSKYCVKTVQCPNNKVTRGKPNECVELDEAQILAEHAAEVGQRPKLNAAEQAIIAGTESTMEVAMIDFPCQPGYLPDYRGRCREVW